MPARDRHGYILIVPSLFTTGNLFCGFYSILRAFNGDFERASYGILVAALFDILDGMVARLTKSSSHFGVEYDSIADVVSFGLAPAILAYSWALESFGRLGWAAAFFFAACGALRLARFNSAPGGQPKSHFVGLPTPAAANFISSIVIAHYELRFPFHNILMLIVCFSLGLLMVSTIRYRAFKSLRANPKKGFLELVLVTALLASVAVKHEIALVVIFSLYILWGLALEGLRLTGLLTEKNPKVDTTQVSDERLSQ